MNKAENSGNHGQDHGEARPGAANSPILMSRARAHPNIPRNTLKSTLRPAASETSAPRELSHRRMPSLLAPTVRCCFASALVFVLSAVAADVSAQTAGPLSPSRRKARRPAPPAASSQPAETVMISGELIEVYTTSLLVDTAEGNNIQVILSPGTRFVLADRIITVETLKVGDDVTVHGVKQSPGKLKAIQVSVRLGSLTKASSTLPTLVRSDANRSETRASPPLVDDDGGPPTLRRH